MIRWSRAPWMLIVTTVGCGGRVAPQELVVSDSGILVPPANYSPVQNAFCDPRLGPVGSCDAGGGSATYCAGYVPYCVFTESGLWDCCPHNVDDDSCRTLARVGDVSCDPESPSAGCMCVCPARVSGP